MIQQHFRNEEKSLILQAKKAGIFNHPDNIGKAREFFVENFLKNNLPPKLKYFSGEIIDSTMTPKDKKVRNQLDIGIVREDMPVFLPDGKTAMIPCEAVLATIEVKSQLTKEHLFAALNAIQNWRKLQAISPKTIVRIGVVPPRIQNFIFAYKGPEAKTLLNYISEYAKTKKKNLEKPLFDALVVLEKYTLVIVKSDTKNQHYGLFKQKTDNLFQLMRGIYLSSSGFFSNPPSITPYLENRDTEGKLEFLKL